MYHQICHKTNFLSFFLKIIIIGLFIAVIGIFSIQLAPTAYAGIGFASGDGTEQDPYIISNTTHLQALRILINDSNYNTSYKDKYYSLTADIDLTGYEWTPVGISSTYYFAGHFDGNGHTISNLTITSNNTYNGLFGYVLGTSEAGATISNLGLLNTSVSISSSDFYAGALAGKIEYAVISNCYNTGNVSATVSNWDPNAGGIAGEINHSTISDCYNTGSITGSAPSAPRAGGITAVSNYTDFINCYNTGSVQTNATSTNGTSGYAAGIVALMFNSSSISSSYNTGAITANANAGGSNSASARAGGLVGSAESPTYISDCYNAGEVTATSSGSSTTAYSGGIVANANTVTISRCYNTSTVAASAGVVSYRGGIAGRSATSECQIIYCYALIGMGYDAFYGTGTAPGTCTGNVASTENELETQSTYIDWDFLNETANGTNDIWFISPAYNNGYPQFTFILPVITYDYNYYGSVNTSFAYLSDTVITLETPLRTAYIFEGWSVSADGEATLNGGTTYSNTVDVTLYAVWTPAVLNVTLGEASTDYVTLAEGWAAAMNAATSSGTRAVVKLFTDISPLAASVYNSYTYDCLVVDYDYITLDLNGYTISRNASASSEYVIMITNYGNLIITDTSGGGQITDCTGSAVYNCGTLTINNGIFTNNASGSNGGVVYSTGTFVMNGGSISGNSSAYHGGGVYSTGTFTMNGGTIGDNTAARYGGGICTTGAFTMNGGTISDNTSSGGGGVSIFSSGTFTMNGGSVSFNESVTQTVNCIGGGGVNVSDNGTFTLNDGEITGNYTSSYGGGVHIRDNSSGTTTYIPTFIMSGGEISGNQSSSGGGIYIITGKGTITISGGSITDNSVSSYGGAVYFAGLSEGKFNLSGDAYIKGNVKDGTITDGTLESGTGTANNIYLQSSEITIPSAFTGEAAIAHYTSSTIAITLGWTISESTGTITADDNNYGIAESYFYESGSDEKYYSPKYYIIYQSTGNTEGTVPVDNNYYLYDQNITVSGAGTLTKTGYSFEDWNYASNTYAADSLMNVSGSVTDNAFNNTITLTANWSISAPEIISETGYNGTYDGEIHNVSVTASHALDETYTITYQWYLYSINPSYLISGATSSSYDVTRDYYSATNFYCVVSISDGTATSNVSSNAISFTIGKKSLAVVWSGESGSLTDFNYTYSGNQNLPSASLDTGISGETLTLTVSGERINASVSAYTATANLTSYNNNYTVTNLTQPFYIDKAVYDMSGVTFEDASFVYDGAAHSLAVGGTLPVGADNIQLTVAYSNNSLINVIDGPVTVTATYATYSTNYNVPDPVTAELSITPKVLNAVWAGENGSITDFEWVYDGNIHCPSATADPGISGQAVITLTVSGGNINARLSVYAANATFNETNYTLSSFTVNKDFRIVKGEYDMSAVSFANSELIYDGNSHSILITGTLPAGVSAPSYTNNGKTEPGIYTVTVSFTITDQDNYNEITPYSAILTIKALTLTEGSNDITLTNSEGIDPEQELVVVKTESSLFNSNLSNGETVLETYEINLKQGDIIYTEYSGTYTVSIKYEATETVSTIKVLVVENGQVVEKEAVYSNGLITFDISELGEFAIVAESAEGSLVWLAVVFSISTVLLILVLIYGWFKYFKNGKIKLFSIAPLVLFATVFPTSQVTAVIILGVVNGILLLTAAAGIFLIVRNKKKK